MAFCKEIDSAANSLAGQLHPIVRTGLSKFRQVVGVAAAHHGCHGFTRFSMVTAAWRALCRSPCCAGWELAAACRLFRRGLASTAAEYKALLMAADRPRDNDYDGRGQLSNRALLEFCRFFLRTSIDQVRFMQSLLDPANMLRRLELYCRYEAPGRPAPRFVTSELVSKRLPASQSQRSPLRLGFPAEAVERWFPSLYPATDG